MCRLKKRYILVIIPKNQFCEDELESVLNHFNDTDIKVVVLSKSGQEARGMNKTKFQPDGILIDWDKQPDVSGKYDAVLVLGGKGSEKSVWNDSILPQLLTDHYRAGKIVGAIGTSVVALAKAGLVQGSIPAPDDEKTQQALEAFGVAPSDKSISFSDRIIVAKDATAAKAFAQKILETLKTVDY